MKLLPDVSHDSPAVVKGELYRVGMESIEMPIRLEGSETTQVLPARISAFVSLDKPEAKGIHMSRLYLKLQEKVIPQNLDNQLVEELLKEFVESQNGLSQSSEVSFEFDLPLERKALVSGQKGWRQYKVGMKGVYTNGKVQLFLMGEVKYSSTCPCSAALSRQLVKEKFSADFEGQTEVSREVIEEWLQQESSIVATPHAQRSLAQFEVEIERNSTLKIIELLDKTEKILGTPVQAAVKREDEQEFARLNGSQLMFCEDAGRKLQSYFESEKAIVDYKAKLSHLESLHPHDAVCYIRKSQ